MKKANKRLSVYVVAILIIALVTALTVFAFAAGDFDGDGAITNGDVQILLAYLAGKDKLENGDSVADYNGDGVINILDVISLKRFVNANPAANDGWTVGIY